MNTKEKIAVMQAFVEGKEIQVSTRHSTEWKRLVWMPEWDWTSYNYRIKPEPKFVYINVYTELYDGVTESARHFSKYDAESAARAYASRAIYHAIALPVELKEK